MRAPCIDGGSYHAWEKLGVDVWRDRLVRVRQCVWCGKMRRLRYP